jgi:hypothetical protein
VRDSKGQELPEWEAGGRKRLFFLSGKALFNGRPGCNDRLDCRVEK